MEHTLISITLAIVLLPLLSAFVVGVANKHLAPSTASNLAIMLVGTSFALSLYLAKWFLVDNFPPLQTTLYQWGVSGGFHFSIGFLLDSLSAIMISVVTFISFLVHIYSVGYMHNDPGYQRFFSYVSLFTFAMLLIVSANNFLQLFVGWEGVGLVSYLLIGFWFHRESANIGSLKAFIVNRVGDFGFILGIACILDNFGTLDYSQIFATLPNVLDHSVHIIHGHPWNAITVICILLYVGAMAKSAQIPLHVWLPESMEGPTPISALIHAATMVTAGIYMVARLSPLYQHAPQALSLILIVGASGALFTGLIAIVQHDIKRVIAYSTMSQLGYMMAALGVSAYSAGIFHLVTHACFKALLFLAAGSVILGMHHNQDMREMGGLWKKMPITYITFLIGSLALCAIPPFSGFYSKDAIIEAVQHSTVFGAHYSYLCVLIGSFVTALYSFRAIFMTFHGKPRYDTHHLTPHESAWVVLWPLILLSLPSIALGAYLVKPILLQAPGLFSNSLVILSQGQTVHETALTLVQNCIFSPIFWVAVSGIVAAWIAYVLFPRLPYFSEATFYFIYYILIRKYGFDAFYQFFFVKGTRFLARIFYRFGDVLIIDDFFVNGSGRLVQWLGRMGRKLQSGFIYNYVFIMMTGFIILLAIMFRNIC